MLWPSADCCGVADAQGKQASLAPTVPSSPISPRRSNKIAALGQEVASSDSSFSAKVSRAAARVARGLGRGGVLSFIEGKRESGKCCFSPNCWLVGVRCLSSIETKKDYLKLRIVVV